MKKLICLFLSISFLLMGCKDKEQQIDTAELNSAVSNANGENLISGNYMLEISFGQGSVLYYANGDIQWDRAEKKAYADFDQTFLGVSSKLENFFSNGKIISVEDGESITTDRDADEMFSKFPYFLVANPEGEIKKGSNSSGDAYSFKITDTKGLSDDIMPIDDIYALVNVTNVLKKPQKDKTEYSVADCIYTVKDGKLVSARYEFDIKLFDTPSYTPNYSQPEDEYTITVHITAKVNYNSFGDGIEIPEYSETSENENISK